MSPVTRERTWKEVLDGIAAKRQIMALARACAAADPDDHSPGTWKRYLSRYRNEGVIPEEAQAQIIAQALGTNRNLLPQPPSRQDRLRSVEAEVVVLRRWVTLAFEALGVEPDLEDEARRAVNGDGPP